MFHRYFDSKFFKIHRKISTTILYNENSPCMNTIFFLLDALLKISLKKKGTAKLFNNKKLYKKL